MRNRTPIALLSTAACAILVMLVPASVTAKRWNGWSESQVHYLNVYEKCWHKLGADCGRNIVDDNLSSGREPSRDQVQASSDRMTQWLNPPPPPEPVAAPVSEGVAPTTATTSVAPAPVSTGGSGCTGMEAESGNSYTAVNPSSGAYGCYQILPSTAAAHGCSLSTPAGQDECAQRICATEGNGAWAASGAAPC